MMLEQIDLLAKEKVVHLSDFLASPKKYLKGIVRLVDEKTGSSKGLYFNMDVLKDMVEDMKASSSSFIKSLEESRKSGRVSSKKVKEQLNL